MSPKTNEFCFSKILGKTQIWRAQEFSLKRMNFEERKNVPQNAMMSAAQEFRAKRKDFEERKNFGQNARMFGETQ